MLFIQLFVQAFSIFSQDHCWLLRLEPLSIDRKVVSSIPALANVLAFLQQGGGPVHVCHVYTPHFGLETVL